MPVRCRYEWPAGRGRAGFVRARHPSTLGWVPDGRDRDTVAVRECDGLCLVEEDGLTGLDRQDPRARPTHGLDRLATHGGDVEPAVLPRLRDLDHHETRAGAEFARAL